MNTTTATTSENTSTKEENTSAGETRNIANIPDDPVEAAVEPDSLMMNNNNNTEEAGTETAPETEDEIVQAFENAEENDVEVADRATSVDMSAASRYAKYFI